MTAPDPLFDDIYRDVIVDHYRAPRHRGSLDAATNAAEGLNPVCGDEVRIETRLEDGTLAAYGFSGQGCAISQASASILGDMVEGQALEAVEALLAAYEGMLRGSQEAAEVDLGDLEAMRGIAQLPQRVKCAMLAARVLDQALHTNDTEMKDTISI